ncbi:MAG: ACT domain-containing protein [Dehalococcoidia bacterium]|nr:ACT domain-containing protein [Dehalococcoidia bacterium]
MKQYIVMSGVGKDRVGIVNRIAHGVASAGGNIEMQRAAKLAGDFAVIMLVSVDEDQTETGTVIDRLNKLSTRDFAVTARKAFDFDDKSGESAIQAELAAEGADQPGIIDAVTLFLVQKNISLTTMDYDVANAPMTGTTLLQLKARLSIPNDVDVSGIENDLADLERDLGIRITVRIST